uniref:Uncharacterized protein n=1 Tax=Tetranychus urticae TaxID=32264 RepID=T1KKB8_TETUR
MITFLLRHLDAAIRFRCLFRSNLTFSCSSMSIGETGGEMIKLGGGWGCDRDIFFRLPFELQFELLIESGSCLIFTCCCIKPTLETIGADAEDRVVKVIGEDVIGIGVLLAIG